MVEITERHLKLIFLRQKQSLRKEIEKNDGLNNFSSYGQIRGEKDEKIR
jgi:hypothetical protein